MHQSIISFSLFLSLPHDFSIVPGDVTMQHHGVQLYAALVEVLLWDRTELHGWTWANRKKETNGYKQLEMR